MTIRRSVSVNRVWTPARCWRCWRRRTLSKRVEDYVRAPKCLSCGTPSLFLCRDRLTRGRREGCNCSGYWFKHRRGSKWCEHNPKIEEHYAGAPRTMRRRAA